MSLAVGDGDTGVSRGSVKDGEDLLVNWGWDQRGKGNQSRFSTTELGIRLGD